ncbi:hypothetical protein LR48_Vigan03g204400 [Vigna angularis]|uniref:Ubiquitin-like protease family profile domain-containing protein n=2 Tax=Phaseolus angularis TaxID=3914 RepID=A0A0L9U7Q2_PHAAN|nr:hypothetical protein LR48_Vigan03g204400 [Vigna angularis]
MVRRWVPHHQSFRVSQHLVPFNVQDVFMSLGLGVGGLDVPFDESVVGKVGESFNSKCTKLKDLIDMFNVLLWAYERLGLHDDYSAKEFPRVRRFSLLNYTTKKIDVMFRTAEVQFDWYLSENDCLNPIIRRAFNLDEGLRREGSKSEEKPAENEHDENWLLATLEKLRTNNARIRKVRDEIAAVRKVLGDRLKYRKVEQSRSFHEQHDPPADEKHEQPADEQDEQPADDKPASTTVEEEERVPLQHPELLTDIGDDVHHGEGDVVVQPFCSGPEGVGDVEGEGTEGGAHVDEENEQPADEEPASTTVVEEGVAGDHPIVVIDVGDGVDDGEGDVDVEPLNVLTLCSFVGDPKTVVDLDMLYHAVTRRDIPRRYVSEIMYQLLSTSECSSLGPRQCVDNMTHVLHDYRKRPMNQHVWQLLDYQPYFRYDLVRLQALLSADWVFIPIVSDGHWWCYALKVCTFQFYVIDSLANGIKGRCRIDRSIAQNIQRFWGLLTDKLEESKCPLLVEKANIPVQPNTYDCGVIMMKAIEIWDGEDKYDGKSMPDYTNEELAAFRKKYICDWILDEDNVRRLDTLQHFGLL